LRNSRHKVAAKLLSELEEIASRSKMSGLAPFKPTDDNSSRPKSVFSKQRVSEYKGLFEKDLANNLPSEQIRPVSK